MEKRYADIIVDISHEKLDRTFQYEVPYELWDVLKPGMVVTVPFGQGGRTIKGYVLELSETPKIAPDRIKPIREASTDAGSVESRLIALAWWIRETYGSTMIQALKTVIPIKQKIKQKEKRVVRRLISREEAEARLAVFQKKHQVARARMLEALLEQEELSYELVTSKLNISAAVLKYLEQDGILQVVSTTVYRNPVGHLEKKEYTIELNPMQREVAEGIIQNWKQQDEKPCLLRGITGSGKTEVYMELIDYVLKQGKQAIVLIPEIALTYQTVLRFYRRFGERISIINSRLSLGERYDQFERARKGDIDIMIGPRSALFTPFPNLGIIIMDEEHETSYKSESSPRFQAREAAIERGRLEGAKVVLGSATPSLDAYYRAQTKEYHLFTLDIRAKESMLPTVEIVDMREELKEGSRSGISRSLRNGIEDRLQKGHQVMLFLNRRGYAGFLSCRSCGHVLQCPHCDVSLALHNGGRLICHYCGHEESRPLKCPSCQSEFIREFKAGTQQIEALVKQEFPEARVLRMDLDTTGSKKGHEEILSAFANHEADILIGTQMIVKGHDFPAVTLVGILAADISLHASDYRAGERTFQLLTQAAGRAGRGSEPGEVVIQTYDPEHYCIQAAAKQDYPGFYEMEMAFRSLAGYPPAAHMLAIHVACLSEQHLIMAMEYLGKFLERIIGERQIKRIGPAWETVGKVNDVYRMIVYVKHENLKMLTMIKNKVEQYIEVNKGYENVNVQFDVD